MKIVIHIDRLVFDGFTPHTLKRNTLRAAVGRELERLMTAGNVMTGLHHGEAVPSLRGEDVRVRAEMDSSSMGKAVGRAVYGALEKIR